MFFNDATGSCHHSIKETNPYFMLTYKNLIETYFYYKYQRTVSVWQTNQRIILAVEQTVNYSPDKAAFQNEDQPPWVQLI